ncbi:sensor histidine kinase [Confluentibacter citreus]|uniref:sensor histidine kinase n=1 Tax=Confluentibacter citreus TaxID=2007307 RepID=UPI000C288BA8|nr:sensor histidine kinase [Confluentibacter citreus]
MKIRHSIVTRFALFFTGLIIVSILLSGYLVFNNASRVIVDYSKERIMHTSELAEQSFYALLNEVSNDIAVISNSPTLKNYIAENSNKTTEDVHELFKVTLKNKESYFQIRLIGVENNGKEIIRLDKINQQVIISNNLQEKGSQEYFKEAIKMNKGDFYFSEINLNEEYGVISEPHIPTLRAASPIFDANNTVIGIVIINIDLTKLFGTLSKISGNEFKLYLIDHNGQYLYSPVKAQRFGVQTKNNFNFYDDFDLKPNSILKNGFNQLNEKAKGDVLSYIKELTYFQGLRTLYLVSAIEDNVLMESASLVRKNSIQTLLGVCLLSILISWFFVRFFSKKINKITEAISNYDKGIDNSIELPINRKDEIGALASTFNKMKAKIDSQVSALQTSLEKEKEARNQRDEFLQNMSHEMRTPLNAILGLTKLLHKNAPSEAQLPIINTLERTSNSLAGLVYDVLDHKKLTEGKVYITHESTSIEDLLKDIYATYQYEAIQKGLTFTLNIDEKLKNQSFLTDALRLSQIVINLVVNAIKYTQEGTINLSAKLINEEASLLEIRVTDSGIGILPENIDRINDRFFREKDDLSGRYGSYGLGLSIVKQLTILFGGTLKAVSEKGKGSEFCVKVPVISALKTETKMADKLIVYPKLKREYKILHIEDDLSTLELISYIFDVNKIELIQLNKWNLVNENIHQNKPDIIISDLMLENENLSAKLLDWISTKKVTCPIILVSATEPEVMSQISALYFQKPFNIDYLKDIVFKLLGSNEYSVPDFSNIYSNYDHNSTKINKVLKLLEEEFETYIKRIDTVFRNKDENEWEAILHKLIAHINNLKLASLFEVLPQKVKDITIEDLENIHDAFAYYLCCIRVEIQINLKD